MPSKLRWAIGALKDQTSIGLAKVSWRGGSEYSGLDIAVLKATSHDEVPVQDRHANEVLLLAASSPEAATALVRALVRRAARTRCWVVALKTLLLAFRALVDGGPYFPRAAFAAASRRDGHRGGMPRFLDFSGFSDTSDESSPWDFTAFVRTFSLYLDSRLESFLLGKLHRYHRHNHKRHSVASMRPAVVLDRIGHWQRLLHRSIAMRPTGAAKTNRLVQISLYPIVRESFDLYRDVSDGLKLLLDKFFQLPYPACIETFRACAKAAQQFEELDALYGLCKSIGVGRAAEYPSVQKISKDLLKTVGEFLSGNQSASLSPASKSKSPLRSLLTAPMDRLEDQAIEQLKKTNRASSAEMDWLSDTSAADGRPRTSSSWSINNDGTSSSSVVVTDLILFDDQPQASLPPKSNAWELVLVESATDISSKSDGGSAEGMKPSPLESLYDQPSYKNPFLHDVDEEKSLVLVPPPVSSVPPPTFRVEEPGKEMVVVPEKDPFSSAYNGSPSGLFQTSVKQQLLREQQLWMQHQSKIISKNMF